MSKLVDLLPTNREELLISSNPWTWLPPFRWRQNVELRVRLAHSVTLECSQDPRSRIPWSHMRKKKLYLQLPQILHSATISAPRILFSHSRSNNPSGNCCILRTDFVSVDNVLGLKTLLLGANGKKTCPAPNPLIKVPYCTFLFPPLS